MHRAIGAIDPGSVGLIPESSGRPNTPVLPRPWIQREKLRFREDRDPQLLRLLQF